MATVLTLISAAQTKEIIMRTVTGLYDTFDHANRAVSDLISGGFNRSEISLLSSNSNKAYDPYFDTEGKYISTNTMGNADSTNGNLGTTTSYANDTNSADDTVTTGEGAAKGAGIGAALGGLGGVLMGLGLLAIPGVGPALAAGALVSGLVGAGIGGVAGGVSGALVNAGVTAEDAEYYSEGVRRGGHLVVVTTDDERAMSAQDILNRHNPVNVRERSEQWRQEGWTSTNQTPMGSTSDGTRNTMRD
jgi:hypothetical protein